MKILVLGADGYLGWPTSMRLAKLGHRVFMIDNFSKRKIEIENQITPLMDLTPIQKKVTNCMRGIKLERQHTFFRKLANLAAKIQLVAVFATAESRIYLH